MTWLVPKLDRRVQILFPRLEPNDDGGGDLLFAGPNGVDVTGSGLGDLSPIKTIWMGVTNSTYQNAGGSYIRGEQVNENTTHMFICRKNAVSDLGKEFSSAFSIAFKYMPDLMNLKSDYYLFLQNGSAVKGRLFKIGQVSDHMERDEYLKIYAEEIEERGTGYPS